jgi:hypothetical protein
MQTLTIRAGTREVAAGLFTVLDQFGPELTPADRGGYDVTVAIDQSPDQLAAVLSALQEYVTRRNDGPAVLELDGETYSIDPTLGSPRATGP